MIVQSVFIGKPVDYSPDDCKVYGVLTMAYKDNKYWICVGEFDQAYLRPKTVMSRRNKTCWKGKYGVPFNDGHQYIRMIAEDSFTLLHMRLYGGNSNSQETVNASRTLEEVKALFGEDKSFNPVIWSTCRPGKPMFDPADPTKLIYCQPVYANLLDKIHLPDADLSIVPLLLKEALERCTGQLMSEVLLATIDRHFEYEGEWDFLRKEGAV